MNENVETAEGLKWPKQQLLLIGFEVPEMPKIASYGWYFWINEMVIIVDTIRMVIIPKPNCQAQPKPKFSLAEIAIKSHSDTNTNTPTNRGSIKQDEFDSLD